MSKRFTVLDSFRGLFAFIVAVFHYKAAGPIGQLALFQRGGYFVDFFFVLSGFIIYHTYANLALGQPQVQFMKNRFYRLYPLHFVMLLVFLLMETGKFVLYEKGLFKSPVFDKNNFNSFIVNLFLCQSFSPTPTGWNYPSWSISAEMVTYIVFCLSIVFINRLHLPQRIGSFIIISLISLAAIYQIRGNIDLIFTSNFSMLRCIYGFFMGCLTYECYKLLINKRRLSTNQITILEAGALITSLVLAAYIPDRLNFVLPVFFAFTILVFSVESGVLSQLLNNRLLNKVGELSYSIYMTHATIAIVFEIALGMLKVNSPALLSAALGIYLVTIFFVSTITHRYIEVGLRKLLQRQSAPKLIDSQVSNPVNISL